MEYRAFCLTTCAPFVAPDQLSLDGFEEHPNHGIEAPIFVKRRFGLISRRRAGCRFRERYNVLIVKRVVMRTANSANAGFQSGIRQPFGVFDRQVLALAVAVMVKAVDRSPFVDRLL